MGRSLRFVPTGGALVEVTTRTIHSRYLLRPTNWVNDCIVGVLARAKQRVPDLRLCGLVFLSNHYHLLLWVPDAKALRTFMEFVNSNLAREIGRLVGWRERFWSRRYQHVVVSHEPRAQVERLRYILAHGVKEDLVHKPEDWPGVHGIRSLLYGEPLRGYWFDRSREYTARQRREAYERLTYATPEVLQLDPLPCWCHMSVEERREQVRQLLAEIEREHRERRFRERRKVLGVNGVKSRHTHEGPRKTKKSLAPLCHAASRSARREIKQAYAAFCTAFRDATRALFAGDRNAEFPEGSFPPALPFVTPTQLARPQPT